VAACEACLGLDTMSGAADCVEKETMNGRISHDDDDNIDVTESDYDTT
jgi:hypothetical protein